MHERVVWAVSHVSHILQARRIGQRIKINDIMTCATARRTTADPMFPHHL
jgi:hypothetical protein